jgi:hypothetical protein
MEHLSRGGVVPSFRTPAESSVLFKVKARGPLIEHYLHPVHMLGSD